jgi:hypothetical protein
MTTRPELLAAFASRYVWWRDAEPPSEDRIIAQVMNYDLVEDHQRLCAEFSNAELRAVMLRAQPGWINERSWHRWRQALGGQDIPANPPRRLLL